MKTTTAIAWRMGVEVELLAPPGQSRLELARAIAESYGAQLERFFHPQTEPSLVAGTPVFHNLTLGYRIAHPDQGWIASCVDDLTLQSDLNRECSPLPGWYRILSDDERLLRLVALHCTASDACGQVLEPLARLFGTAPQSGPDGLIRVDDQQGCSIAIAAPLPGERERACELVSAPMDRDHAQQLERLLGLARSLGFSAPREGATHLHFDATPLQSAGAIANLVHLWTTCGPLLKRLVGSNPYCRRLGEWPPELFQTVSAPDFRDLSWPEARARLGKLPLTKFCDLNLMNCIGGQPTKNTLEVRVLPVFLESGPLLRTAGLFEALFKKARDAARIEPEPPVCEVQTLLDLLPISPPLKRDWLDKTVPLQAIS